MGHATGSILGVTVGSTHTEAKFALMTTSPYTDGGTVMYVQASGAIDQYDFVSIDENGQATALANAGGAAGHMLGCAQVAFADNDYGWVFIEGANFNGNGLASCAADTESLWTTGTAGHIDDANRFLRGQRQPGEAQVDSHLALLFFFEAVGVDAGQGSDQGRFAVINVAGGANDAHG